MLRCIFKYYSKHKSSPRDMKCFRTQIKGEETDPSSSEAHAHVCVCVCVSNYCNYEVTNQYWRHAVVSVFVPSFFFYIIFMAPLSSLPLIYLSSSFLFLSVS